MHKVPILPRTPPSWQQLLADAVSCPQQLLRLLDLPGDLLPAAERAARLFPLRVPRGYIARMTKGDVDDPLLRQVLPLGLELESVAGFEADPVGDLEVMTAPGVLHKYRGRVLLVTTGACAIHCRYCFRRHFPYAGANPARGQWRAGLEYIATDPSIEEVILSGGDPLTLADHRLEALTRGLQAIPHVRRLRIHTRLPIVLPERIDPGMLRWLAGCGLQTVMVVHANHANELDAQVHGALRALRGAGVHLLNQTVLLRGVNDDVGALATLSDTLFEMGVLPYYLHLLDRVAGSAHFEVKEPRAQRLHQRLAARLPGYLVPRLARDQPGADAKLMPPLAGSPGPS